jgi:hypothetical protein
MGRDQALYHFTSELQAGRGPGHGGMVGGAAAIPGASWGPALRSPSPVERLLTGGCNPNADDFGRHGASLRSLAFCGREPGTDEVGDHVAGEAMGTHKQGLGSAARANGNHLQQL